MKHRVILAAAVLAGSLGAAAAQQQPPAPPQGAGAAPPSPAPEGPGPLSEGRGADTPGGPPSMHAHMERGGRPHHRAGAGFEIRMGEEGRLRVRCGDEPIGPCIDAAAPLVDRLSAPPPPSPEPNPDAD